MKQKIEVQVTSAVDERWPKVVGEKDKYPSGSMWYVYQGAEFLHLCRVDVDTTLDTKLGSLVPFASKICFPDFETLADWWTNPQPIKQDPETIKVKDLKSGSFFQVGKDVFLHATCQHCPTLTNIGTTVVFDDNREVIPFYGTITINVGRDAE